MLAWMFLVFWQWPHTCPNLRSSLLLYIDESHCSNSSGCPFDVLAEQSCSVLTLLENTPTWNPEHDACVNQSINSSTRHMFYMLSGSTTCDRFQSKPLKYIKYIKKWKKWNIHLYSYIVDAFFKVLSLYTTSILYYPTPHLTLFPLFTLFIFNGSNDHQWAIPLTLPVLLPPLYILTSYIF